DKDMRQAIRMDITETVVVVPLTLVTITTRPMATQISRLTTNSATTHNGITRSAITTVGVMIAMATDRNGNSQLPRPKGARLAVPVAERSLEADCNRPVDGVALKSGFNAE